MLGYTIEEIELNVRQWTDLHHPDDKESAWKSIQDHLEGKTSEHKIEYRMRAKDGQYKWILDQARIVKRDAHGKPLRMSGTHTDITERKQAEEKNASTERRYRAMIENAPDGLVLINAEGKFLYASPSVERIFGYSQADLPDCNAAEMTYPADLPMVLGELSALMQDAERVTTLQYRFRHKNGEWRWIESTFSNLLDVPDVSAIVINFRDIHDRKQADQALLKSEGHYRMLFESASDGVVLHLLSTDRVKNRFRRFNQNICRMLGYTAEEMAQLGPMDIQPPEELLHVPAEAEQMERDRELRFEKVFRRKDGTLLPTEVHSSVFELDNEMLVLSLIRDVTERKQAESQREAALKKLYESEERYRGLMESLESGVAAVDYEGKFLYMNEVAARQLGGTPQTLIGKTMHELFPETVASKQLAGVRQVFREDKGRVSESLTTLQDEVRWFRSFQQPIHDENGQVAYVLLHATDIHELKSMQQELQSRNRDMSLLLEAGRALGETLDAKQIYSQLHRYISEVMPCDMLIASSYDPQTQLLHCEFLQTSEGPQDVSEFPPIPLEPPGQGTQSQVIRTGKSLLLPDYDQAFKTATTSYIFDEHGKIVEEVPDDPERTRSAIIVPLSAEGEVVGALQIFSTELNAHTEDHLRFVEALAFRVSAALSNAKLFAELEQRVQIRTAEVQDLYNNAPAGYHSLNESGSVIMINQTLLNWLGYTREEVLGRHFAELIAPSSRGTFIQNFPILKQHGQLNNIDVEFLRKDGSTFPVLVNSTAIYDPAGNFVMSRTTVFDNTERKQAEEALRDSEDRYRKLIEFSPIAIVGFGENARFEFLNQKAIETLGGTSTEDFIGKSIFEFVHPDFQAIARERLRFSKESNAYVPAIETVYVKLNGQSVHVISSGVAMNIRGKLMNIVSFFDNTERKQAEKALHESYDRLNMVNLELEKALRVKDEFLASMSHELRTPLTGILGLSEAMQLDVYGELNDRQRRSLQSIHESGDHLLSLINDILDLSKIEAGKLEAQIAPCVLGDICQSSLQLTKGMAQQKNQYVSYSASIVPVVLNADARRVKQILVNLLSNAIKFTPEYGELGLSVEPDAANRQVRLIVWDKGIGIKPENLEKLFKPFTQIDSSLAREYSGTGLGLSLVQRLTKLNNGTVEVESVFGQGSRFIVTLPWTPKLAASDEPEPETPQLASSQPEGDSPQYTHTILIADDNLVLVNMLADFLEAHHYRAVKAESGWEVLDKLTSAKPDLVLMDIQMPGMDGLKTIQHIRNHADPAVASSRIIAVTALAMRGDRERCLAAGANEYISKPVKLKELKEMIEVQLGKR
jgi:PAS domain S-box-containing protein